MLKLRGELIPQFGDELYLVFNDNFIIYTTVTHLCSFKSYRDLSSSDRDKRRQRCIHTSTKYFDPEKAVDMFDRDFYTNFLVPCNLNFRIKDLEQSTTAFVRVSLSDLYWNEELNRWEPPRWKGTHSILKGRLEGKLKSIFFYVDTHFNELNVLD